MRWTKAAARLRWRLLPRDRQQDRPWGLCPRCGRERYGEGPCPYCEGGAL